MSLEAVQRAKARHEGELLRKPNVVGVAVGRKVVGGEETDELCVVVLVRRKVPPEDLRAQDLVPPRVDDVRTDVVETGAIEALGAVLQKRDRAPTDRWRPAPGGVSVGHPRTTAGTLGCVVVRDGTRYVLSNQHILGASNAGRPGDPILQPGPADGGRHPADVLAELAVSVPLRWRRSGLRRLVARRRGTNRVDAALARPVHDDEVTETILGIGLVQGVGEATLDLAVRKSGRTTGVTEGRITHLDATVTVGYDAGRQAVFEGQILTTAMSEGGDSGSLVVDRENRGVGLLFAGSGRVTVLNPVREVLDTLGVGLAMPVRPGRESATGFR